MSNYQDPSWYEHSEQHNVPPSSYHEPDPFSPYAPGYGGPIRQQQGLAAPVPDTRERLRRALRRFVVTVALLTIAFLAGWFSHQFFSNTTAFNTNNQSQAYANLFQQAWTLVDQNYVDRKAVNYKQMSYNAIQAMLGTLKDTGHTRFLTPDQVQAFNQSLSPTLVGVGIYIRQDPTTKQVTVIRTFPGSPAEKAGLKSGDIITAVNGTSVVGKDIDAVSKLLHGQAGTSVSMTIKRPATNQTLTFNMQRAQIQVQNVILHYIPEKHIAHIQIIQFADGVTDQLKATLIQAKKMGATSVILDLRGNPGGLLQQAVDTTSLFMQSGTVFIEQDSNGQRTPYKVSGQPVDTHIPIVVLVDHDTGSSAEIVSGSLKENKRAIIMGTTTFGTGTVLQQFQLADGSELLLGVGEWLTPNGEFIRDHGITPDITVPLTKNQNPLTPDAENLNNMTYQQILNSGDAQLLQAMQYLGTHP
ncbi:MAG: PDZ domain-containing protein [Ktedonobacteraceae bacterium]|nr:PDZ domain-containing protein [Ktedonobacteraceae bacterium]